MLEARQTRLRTWKPAIIGPAYNTLAYVPGSVISQVLTAAQSTTTTTGSITTGTRLLTVASVAGLSAGDDLVIAGAGASGANLKALIVSFAGNVVTLDTSAGTTVTDALVSKAGKSPTLLLTMPSTCLTKSRDK